MTMVFESDPASLRVHAVLSEFRLSCSDSQTCTLEMTQVKSVMCGFICACRKKTCIKPGFDVR